MFCLHYFVGQDVALSIGRATLCDTKLCMTIASCFDPPGYAGIDLWPVESEGTAREVSSSKIDSAGGKEEGHGPLIFRSGRALLHAQQAGSSAN